MENDRYITCPLIDEQIEDIDCIENSDAVKGNLKEESIPSRFKQKENWKEICKKCRWHNY